MTAPEHSAPDPNVTMGVALCTMADGSSFVSLYINVQTASFSFAMPPDLVDQVADSLQKEMHDAAKEARRRNSGLILPR